MLYIIFLSRKLLFIFIIASKLNCVCSRNFFCHNWNFCSIFSCLRREFHLVLYPSTSPFTKSHASKHNNGTSDPVDLSFIYDGIVEGIFFINYFFWGGGWSLLLLFCCLFFFFEKFFLHTSNKKSMKTFVEEEAHIPFNWRVISVCLKK